MGGYLKTRRIPGKNYVVCIAKPDATPKRGNHRILVIPRVDFHPFRGVVKTTGAVGTKLLKWETTNRDKQKMNILATFDEFNESSRTPRLREWVNKNEGGGPIYLILKRP